MQAQGQTVCVSRQMETPAWSETCIAPVLASKYFKAILALDMLPIFYHSIFGSLQNLPDKEACKACHAGALHP